MVVPLDELWVVSLPFNSVGDEGSAEVNGSSVVNSTTDEGFGAIHLKYNSNLLVFLFGRLLKFRSVLEDVIYVL